ncbi:unnamed protein product [Adineta steineri]|uniref:Uncharacterized protein n=1 Tax=Adineta steineri TaxID=433720 RepID=A0A814NRC8_9BILA|nr:unnamed protein product [Adineta steineri]CAF1023514.1 unnamed protein product [Adineta steineri]CAF1095855.1 unnamed protein product [Adineta steineri]CAF1095888.1 unnamed protein product [Adineta steineri]CAF1171626.1 unnamed protein product [Adineta steineri]
MASDRNYNRKVYAGAIQNDTDGDIHIVFTYAGITDRRGDTKQTRVELDVAKGKRGYMIQRLITRETHNIIEVIEQIEVTRSNGSKLELKAPFEGVKTPTTDWLFVVNNTEIKSAGLNK